MQVHRLIMCMIRPLSYAGALSSLAAPPLSGEMNRACRHFNTQMPPFKHLSEYIEDVPTGRESPRDSFANGDSTLG